MDNSTHELFWAKVNKTETCWLWTAYIGVKGYGQVRIKGSQLLAHRVAWANAYGPIPSGQVIDHVCQNRACVRPTHLRLTTNKQNMEHRTGAQANSTSGVRGVSWSKTNKQWRVDVRHNGKTVYGGGYKTVAEAETAAIALRNELFTHNNLDRG